MAVNDKNEETFRDLVNTTRPSIHCDLQDLEEIYRSLRMPANNHRSRNAAIEHIHSEIAATFRSAQSGETSRTDLKALKDQLLLRYFADGLPLHPHYAFLRIIMDATRKDFWKVPSLSNEVVWRVALVNAANCDHISHGSYQHDDALIRKFHPRQQTVAQSAKYIRSLGCEVGIVGGRIKVKIEEQKKIAQLIDSQIKRAGGINFAAFIFSRLSTAYDPVIERYHTTRRSDMPGKEREACVPWAYLLNLCVKYLDAPVTDKAQILIAGQETLDLGRAFTALFDIEPYAMLEMLFRAGEPLPQSLQEIAIFDGIFTLIQARPSVVPKTLRGLFCWVDDSTAIKTLGGTIDQVARVANAVLKLAGNLHTPLSFEVHDVNAPGISKLVVSKLLSKFSHRIGIPNHEYLLPYEQTRVDFGFRPLIETSPGKYVLVNRSWCAPAFYEAVAGALRDDEVVNVDGNIGTALEQYARNELITHGVSVKSGTYRVGGQNGECDAVIETANVVIFIEVKRKLLTRTSRGGQDVDIFVDLSDSLLTAMEQITRHELLLCQHGHLDLERDGVKQRVEWKNRPIERVALSLLDFGAIQHRAVVSQILETVQNARISAKIPGYERQLAKVQKKGEALANLERKLSAYYPLAKGKPFMNCWFLSLGQLLMLLDGVTSNDSFQQSLFTTRHRMTDSFDFYLDHRHMQALRVAEMDSDR